MNSRALVAVAVLLLACGEREASAPTPTPAPPPPAAAAAGPAAPKAPPPRMPRGLVTNAPGATPGYVLFNPLLSDTSYLVDNEGRVVHVWKTAYSPGGGMELLPNGNLLRLARDPAMLGFKAGGTGGILQEIAWDGSVVWEWKLSNAERVLHHDLEPLPNGNVLAIGWEVKTPAELRQAGRQATRIPEQGLWPEFVIEVEPVRPNGANVVWEWHVWDHLIQNHDRTAANHGDPAAHPGRLDLNAGAQAPHVDAAQLEQLQALGYVPADATPQDLESDFLHVNAVVHHPRLDQIALSVPTLNEIWVIDHGTTTAEAAGAAGDLLYRWGNPAVYGRGDASGQRLFAQHDVRWIPDGWEGAGNLMVFNNGGGRPDGSWSSVDEWTPPLGPDGRYAEHGGPFAPAELAWQYRGKPAADFFAPFISGAQRLENGNTLVAAGTGGELYEVTRAGDVVWEYRSPFSGSVRNADGSMPQPGLDENPFALFRATRIAADHPALAGRTLVPLDPQPARLDWRKAP